MVERGFNGVHMAPEEGACCEWEKRGYHLGAVRKTSDVYIQCTHIQFSGGGAILRQLTDNEKMVLLQTCDQLKPH